MSSLIERLNAAKQEAPSPFEYWVSQLPEDDRDVLMKAAADPSIPHRVLFEIVKAEGAAVGRERLTDWRKAHGFPR